MKNYDNFGGVKATNSSVEALKQWRKLCSVVKNPKRRVHFAANLSKSSEVEAMKKTNQEQITIEDTTPILILDEKSSSDEAIEIVSIVETSRESTSNCDETSKINEMFREMRDSLKFLKEQATCIPLALHAQYYDGVPIDHSSIPRDEFTIRCTEIKKFLVQIRLTIVNNADKEELKVLKGIGKKRAAYILELRENNSRALQNFKSIDDLRELGLSTKEINAMMAQALGDF